MTIFLVFIGHSCNTAAQAKLSKAKVDSLKAVWKDEQRPDTTRLSALDQLANEGYMFSRSDSAYYYAQLQVDLARAKGLQDQLARALFTQAVAKWDNYEFSKALEHLQESMSIREVARDTVEIGSCLNTMGNIHLGMGDHALALEYFERSLAIFQRIAAQDDVAMVLQNMGSTYLSQGNYSSAWELFQRSLETAEEAGNESRVMQVRGVMGNLFFLQGRFSKALEHYQQVLSHDEKRGDSEGTAVNRYNIGLIHDELGDLTRAWDHIQFSFQHWEKLERHADMVQALNVMASIRQKQRQYEEALQLLDRAFELAQTVGEQTLIGTCLQSIGEVYAEQGDYSRALDHYERALPYYDEVANRRNKTMLIIAIGKLHNQNNEPAEAVIRCRTGEALATEMGLLRERKEACSCLYHAFKALGDGLNALLYHEQMMVWQDSLQHEEAREKIRQVEFDQVILKDSLNRAEETRLLEAAHQEEVRQNRLARNGFAVGAFVLLLIAGGFYSRARYMRRSRAILQVEKDRSENLLLNILPAEVAEELKAKGRSDARDFEMVSILFTDFKGFTELSSSLSAGELVNEINTCFEAFDAIIGKYGVEKIKTIGDAYMAAGGLPVPSQDSARNTVLAALELQAFISRRKAERDTQGLPAFQMRVGIHTGPVVAGIVGVKKFQYDIWGDTVNTASRMESSGEVGKVNISEITYELVKDDPAFTFTARGLVSAKGKGEMEMYFVERSQD
jgi:adenylate cyclase